ncbi:alpha/beta fold hydrolase [Glacieibacterium megasporae]|uniref:alpha/beta fold hydrolase n=1 Tax=Glacieibacterium megasporae TaxID=2835787 RepID=UPI001C1E1C14|nr:alpha/beta hydrolase [Polymorphobacter megasporae]UAJ11259.1 alpha/beta hydrolase [Polymorphobacter megasporae]
MTPCPTSHNFISQRLRLHYVDWGNPDAPPLLLLHGGRDHCRNWDWVATDLARDWHVIAPDLRGHGDSAWSPDGNYGMAAFVYDLAQLIHGLKLAPLTIVAHSLGGNIALRYTGLYPDNVAKIVAIEGLGPSPAMLAKRDAKTFDTRLRDWIDEVRGLSARQPKRYASVAEALARMMAENKHLSEVQARHLTAHGVLQNEDGSYSWKFDNYIRGFSPVDMPYADLQALWGRITCPTLLVYGAESWASNPAADGRLAAFRNARVELFDRAGHWVHHDRTADFIACVRSFLNERHPREGGDPSPTISG